MHITEKQLTTSQKKYNQFGTKSGFLYRYTQIIAMKMLLNVKVYPKSVKISSYNYQTKMRGSLSPHIPSTEISKYTPTLIQEYEKLQRHEI